MTDHQMSLLGAGAFVVVAGFLWIWIRTYLDATASQRTSLRVERRTAREENKLEHGFRAVFDAEGGFRLVPPTSKEHDDAFDLDSIPTAE